MACSYHGELVGLMAIHLILLAINEVNPGLTGLVHILRLFGGTGNGQESTSLKGALTPGPYGRPEEYSGQLQQPYH